MKTALRRIGVGVYLLILLILLGIDKTLFLLALIPLAVYIVNYMRHHRDEQTLVREAEEWLRARR